MALCEGFNEGKTLLERYYLLAASYGKPEVSYCDGAHAQICITLCEAFNEGEVCYRRLYLPASHGNPRTQVSCSDGIHVCMALCKVFNGRDLQIQNVTPSPPSCCSGIPSVLSEMLSTSGWLCSHILTHLKHHNIGPSGLSGLLQAQRGMY